VHVRLLHHVLGLAIVTQDGARRPVDAFVVATHQHFEERRLASENLGDHLLVGQRAPLLEGGTDHTGHAFSKVRLKPDATYVVILRSPAEAGPYVRSSRS